MVTKTDKIVLTDGAGNVKGEITASGGVLYFNGEAISGSPKKAKKPSSVLSEDEVYSMNVTEQESKLLELGMSSKDIKKLKYEKDRVKAIMNLLKKN